jgi:hypothetical protein
VRRYPKRTPNTEKEKRKEKEEEKRHKKNCDIKRNSASSEKDSLTHNSTLSLSSMPLLSLPHRLEQCQSGYITNFRCSVAGSSPRSRKQRWNNLRSIGYCSRLARCCPETSALTLRATRRCLCMLINGSRCMDDGSGGSASNTSECAGAEKLPETGSMLTNSVGAVGSIRSGRRQTRCNGAR